MSHANALNVPCPELFVKQDPTLNAYTFGTNDDACVVVHSAIVDLLDEQELSFILAHEVGHVKARHVTYGSVLSMVSQGLLGPLAGFPAFAAPFDAWSREAEQTADQIGIILAPEPAAAIRALMLLAVGSRTLLAQMNIAPYLAQQDELADLYGKWNLYFGGNTHPYIVTRVLNLLRFAQTEPAREARMALRHLPLRVGKSASTTTMACHLSSTNTPHKPGLNFCPECGFEIAYRPAVSCAICGFRFPITK